MLCRASVGTAVGLWEKPLGAETFVAGLKGQWKGPYSVVQNCLTPYKEYHWSHLVVVWSKRSEEELLKVKWV